MAKKRYPEEPQRIGDIDMVKILAALNEDGIIYRIIDLIKDYLLVENRDCVFINKEKDISIKLIAMLFIAIKMGAKIERPEHICAICEFFNFCSFPRRN